MGAESGAIKFKPPFPYFGGKSRVVKTVWDRFGDTRNYVEPFCGSCAILLNRPHWPWEGNRIETINDKDAFLSNFWRTLQADPDGLAHWADWPVNEVDLHARHLWLMTEGMKHVEKLKTDPDYFDVKIAGWWVWGTCQWIGSGWCSHPEWKKRPHLGNAGMGVHRVSQQLPHLGNPGRGVHRVSQQLPHLTHYGQGIHQASISDLHGYFSALSERLRRVRVCCGDWKRVLGPSPTVKNGLTSLFMDPPYTAKAGRADAIYACEDLDVGHEVRNWCVEHGDNPMLRIALCGYEGEYDMPESWECVAWKTIGGYGGQGKKVDTGKLNRHRERIWFSPHCLKVRDENEEDNGLF